MLVVVGPFHAGMDETGHECVATSHGVNYRVDVVDAGCIEFSFGKEHSGKGVMR